MKMLKHVNCCVPLCTNNFRNSLYPSRIVNRIVNARVCLPRRNPKQSHKHSRHHSQSQSFLKWTISGEMRPLILCNVNLKNERFWSSNVNCAFIFYSCQSFSSYSLRSRSSFVLVVRKEARVFLWHGCKSSVDSRLTAKAAAEKIQERYWQDQCVRSCTYHHFWLQDVMFVLK